jgi:hypothetical protein
MKWTQETSPFRAEGRAGQVAGRHFPPYTQNNQLVTADDHNVIRPHEALDSSVGWTACLSTTQPKQRGKVIRKKKPSDSGPHWPGLSRDAG